MSQTLTGTIWGGVTFSASPAIVKPKPQGQKYVAKGSAPWCNDNSVDYLDKWSDRSKITNVDESTPGQATVTCKGVTNMHGMFCNCTGLTSIDLTNFDTSNVYDMANMFASDIFSRGGSLTKLDLSNLDTSKVKYMQSMFFCCCKLTTLDLSSFDTSNVENMGGMFFACNNLTALDLSNFDTSNVTDMNELFFNCKSLISLDLSSFDTSNVENMNGMFVGCSKLTSLDLSSFNTSKVTDMYSMFTSCSCLTKLDLSRFNTSKVTDMRFMFSECSNLTTIKGIIDMKSCTDYGSIKDDNFDTDTRMFKGCSKLKGVKIKNPPARFDGAGLSSSQYTIVS